jgi:hypothetical protein
MADDYVECPELAGKTIKSLRLYKNSAKETRSSST